MTENLKPIVYLGSDHGGFELKENTKLWLTEWGFEFVDLGAIQLNPEDDFPKFALEAAKGVANAILQGQPALGILFCKSGAGMCIAANKIDGIRAASANSMLAVEHARDHDNINVLCLQGAWLEPAQARHLVLAFLNTPFSGSERHVRRLAQITDFERTGKIS
jgi:ribose 5-phosphate isomerase B